ncbi:MAG: hypothetical protein KC486_17680, partial [Myxococcales bacterium]|nr:hypothetical protein [Myxococcales bacterium]
MLPSRAHLSSAGVTLPAVAALLGVACTGGGVATDSHGSATSSTSVTSASAGTDTGEATEAATTTSTSGASSGGSTADTETESESETGARDTEDTGSEPLYDPLAQARETRGTVKNREAVIPPQCYTKTEAHYNPCWTCHTVSTLPNSMSDVGLQTEYSFSDVGLTNAWTNLFEDHAAELAALSDEDVLAYIRTDNYGPLVASLARFAVDEYPGYRPDLDFTAGFDERGFASDGSEWRAFRYKPFLGTFWPTNGNTDDVMIRLPAKFRQLAGGRDSRDVYRVNLAILEAAIAGDPAGGDAQEWPTEPLDETLVGVDLNADGELTSGVTTLVGLPASYVGSASDWPVRRGVYPEGTEFLHSVRYVDPDAPAMIAARMKELRYSKKAKELDNWAIFQAYEAEFNKKEDGVLPLFTGSPLVGLRNDFGWQL